MRSNKWEFKYLIGWAKYWRDAARYQMKTNSPWAAAEAYQKARDYLQVARKYYNAMKAEDKQFNNMMAY